MLCWFNTTVAQHHCPDIVLPRADRLHTHLYPEQPHISLPINTRTLNRRDNPVCNQTNTPDNNCCCLYAVNKWLILLHNRERTVFRRKNKSYFLSSEHAANIRSSCFDRSTIKSIITPLPILPLPKREWCPLAKLAVGGYLSFFVFFC